MGQMAIDPRGRPWVLDSWHISPFHENAFQVELAYHPIPRFPGYGDVIWGRDGDPVGICVDDVTTYGDRLVPLLPQTFGGRPTEPWYWPQGTEKNQPPKVEYLTDRRAHRSWEIEPRMGWVGRIAWAVLLAVLMAVAAALWIPILFPGHQ
jgi:hypothetical protein